MTADCSPPRAATPVGDDFSQQLLGAIGAALVVTDGVNEIVVWNAAAERLLGWGAPDALGRTLVDLGLDALEPAHDAMVRADLSGAAGRELHLRHQDGRSIPVLLLASRMHSLDGDGAGAVLVMTDLTQRLAAERRLRATHERLELLVKHSADMVALVDAAGTVLFVGATAAEDGRFAVSEVVGRSCFEFVHPDDGSRLRHALVDVVENRTVTALKFRFRTKRGPYRWMQGRAVNLLDHPNVGAVLVAVHDITDRVALELRLAHQATHDSLTGLPNRALLVDRLAHHVEHARRRGMPVAVLLWDLNEFKRVNDLAGHAVGDWVLIETANHALRAMRAEDTVARLGGDEFVGCAEVEDVAQARALADRLLADLPVEVTLLNGGRLRVTSSIGLACGDGASADQLLAEADRAMYEAKRAGGDLVVVRTVVPGDGPGADRPVARSGRRRRA